MKRKSLKFLLKPGLHQFRGSVFGLRSDLVESAQARINDMLLIACSEQGSAPDNISFASPERLVILQHIGASMPSKLECERYEELSCEEIEKLFWKHDFRHVIICGHLGCGVIRNWLLPIGYTDIGNFRHRFEEGARKLVDQNYSPYTVVERCNLMICEHVFCQIENMLTHPFIMDRVRTKRTSFHGWIIDDQSARVFGYSPEESAFVPI